MLILGRCFVGVSPCALDPLGKNIHLYEARNYMPDLIKRDNVGLYVGGWT